MKILDIPRSGSYAGITSSHNRAGQYVRNRRAPTQAPSARRTFMRTAMHTASAAYSALLPAYQAAWIAFADAHPTTDALGSAITLTGHQYFVKVATQLINCAQPLPTSPPVDAAVYSLAGSTATFSVATGLSVTLAGTGAATDYCLIALSKPVPNGRRFWKTYRQQTVVAPTSGPFTMTTVVYGAAYGVPVAGNVIFVKLTPVSAAGNTGTALVLRTVVSA